MLTRETVTFREDDGWSWEFDLTFMLSNYQCIWGRGCPDTRLQHTARGCCVDGVEIYTGHGDTPGREDLKKIRGRGRELTDEDWQNRRVVHREPGRVQRRSTRVRHHGGRTPARVRRPRLPRAGCLLPGAPRPRAAQADAAPDDPLVC